MLRALLACVGFVSLAAAAGPPEPTPTPGAVAAVTSVPDGSRENAEFLDRIRQYISGRESEPAETVFKNIVLLKGKPASRLPGMMSALTGLLGTSCTTCHVPGNWSSDELATKKTARRHFEMQSALNREYFAGQNAITCWTCHRGKLRPAALP